MTKPLTPEQARATLARLSREQRRLRVTLATQLRQFARSMRDAALRCGGDAARWEHLHSRAAVAQTRHAEPVLSPEEYAL